jgi:cytoskeletal protein RodZ
MADPDRKDPHRPDHPGDFPKASRPGPSKAPQRIGIAVAVLLLVGLLWWIMGGAGTTPGQEHTLGEPAGVGTAADPDPEAGEIDAAADPDDPQAAIGADPHTEPTSPEAAEQAGAAPPTDADTAEGEAEGAEPGN